MTDYERETTRETSVVDPSLRDPAVSSTVRTTESASVPARPEGPVVAARIVTFAFGVLQAALILRLVLLVLVANPGNDVVALILGVTDPFVEPFRGMFALDRVRADQGSVFDIAALVALVGWTLIEALLLAAFRIFARRPAEI
ncbi:MAG: YggT family protein [Candidatus Limnocylindrales bacterium]|nr:YggT family protein [Candidatus Limnocylindrales bacterium]